MASPGELSAIMSPMGDFSMYKAVKYVTIFFVAMLLLTTGAFVMHWLDRKRDLENEPKRTMDFMKAAVAVFVLGPGVLYSLIYFFKLLCLLPDPRLKAPCRAFNAITRDNFLGEATIAAAGVGKERAA